MRNNKRKRSNAATTEEKAVASADKTKKGDNKKHEEVEPPVKKRGIGNTKTEKRNDESARNGSNNKIQRNNDKSLTSDETISPHSGQTIRTTSDNDKCTDAIMTLISDDRPHQSHSYNEVASKTDLSGIQQQRQHKSPSRYNYFSSTKRSQNVVTPKRLDEVSEVISFDSTMPTNIVHIETTMVQNEEEKCEEEIFEEKDDEISIHKRACVSIFRQFAFFTIILAIVILYLLDKHYMEMNELGADFNIRIIHKNMEQNELQILLNNTQNELETKFRELKLSEEKGEQCATEFNSLDKEYNALILKSKSLSKQLDAKSMQLYSSMNSEEEISNKLDKARKEIDLLLSDKKKLLESNSSCNSSLTLMSNQNEADTRYIDGLEASLMDADEEKKTLKLLHEKELAMRKDVESSLAKSQSDVQDLQSNIDTLMAQKSDLILSYSYCNNTVASLSKERDDTSKRIVELEVTFSKTSNDLKFMLSEHEDKKTLLEDLEEKLAASLEETSKLQDRLNEEIAKGDSYKIKIDELDARIKSLTKEMNELAKSNTSCQNAMATLATDNDTSVKRIADLEASLIDADEDKKTLKISHQKEISLRQDLESSLNVAQQSLDKEGAKRWYYLLQIKHLQEEIEQKDFTIEEVQKQNDILKLEKEALTVQIDKQLKETVLALNSVAKTAASLKIEEMNGGYKSQMERDAILSSAIEAVTAVVTTAKNSDTE